MEAKTEGKFKVWEETFAVVKAKESVEGAFANINDGNEITVIIDETKLSENSVIKIEKGWKLIAFDMVFPFEMVGFISKISKVLADNKISIFVISSYSTNHILIKRENLEKTVELLEGLGFERKWQK
jgi:hypothetical protein